MTNKFHLRFEEVHYLGEFQIESLPSIIFLRDRSRKQPSQLDNL